MVAEKKNSELGRGSQSQFQAVPLTQTLKETSHQKNVNTAKYLRSANQRRKHKLESRLPGEISRTSDMEMTPP